MSFITRPPLDKTRSLLLLLLIVVLAGLAVSMLFRNSGRDTQQFSGDRAFSHVKAIVELGPSPIGLRGIEKGRQVHNR